MKNRKRDLSTTHTLFERAATVAKKDIWAGLIPALGLFIFSLVLSIQGQDDARTGMQSLGWKTACGQIVATDVVCNRMTDSYRHSHGLSSRSSTTCAAVVIYRYRAGGTDYTGKRFRIAAGGNDAYSSGDRKACEEWGKKNYPPGKEVRVHYDPRDPGEAALEAGVSGTSLWFIIIGSLLAGPACFMALLALPENRWPPVPIRILLGLAAILLVGGINMFAFTGGVSGFLTMI